MDHSAKTDADQARSDPARWAKLGRQLEFYFSEKNLQTDMPLRAEVNSDGAEGWVNCAWFLQCPLVSKVASSTDDIRVAVTVGSQNSELEFRSGPNGDCQLRHRTRKGCLPPLVQRFRRKEGYVLLACNVPTHEVLTKALSDASSSKPHIDEGTSSTTGQTKHRDHKR